MTSDFCRPCCTGSIAGSVALAVPVVPPCHTGSAKPCCTVPVVPSFPSAASASAETNILLIHRRDITAPPPLTLIPNKPSRHTMFLWKGDQNNGGIGRVCIRGAHKNPRRRVHVCQPIQTLNRECLPPHSSSALQGRRRNLRVIK